SDVDYMQESEAKTFSFLRPEQGITHLLITLVALFFYAKVFVKFFSENISYSKDELLTGLFSSLFLSQGIVDVIFLLIESVFDLPRYFPCTWPFYYGLNDTVWTTVLEVNCLSVYNNSCFLISSFSKRITSLLWPSTSVLEKTPRIIILLIKFLIPGPLMTQFF
ncbi:hypothetical protein PENTCL1PPCAC_17108, partial [Pristionchus entomophagus]